MRATRSHVACGKVHFRRIILPHTDVSLGDCSYLDTCRHMKTCKFVHYAIDRSDAMKVTEARNEPEGPSSAIRQGNGVLPLGLHLPGTVGAIAA